MNTSLEYTENEEVAELTEAEETIQGYFNPLLQAAQEELTFKYDEELITLTEGFWDEETNTYTSPTYEARTLNSASIASGILWIPPFVNPSPEFFTKKKPAPVKCICTCCGSKHNRKGKV